MDVNKMISRLKWTCIKEGITGAVIGISGGKDSTVVAKLMVEVLGKENVVGVLMPNGIQKDITDSQRVVDLLGIKSIVVNIGESYESICSNIYAPLICNTETALSSEAKINIAPRLRMTTLYAIAQSLGHGWRVIGTTNKSEDYIGWVTKWGDAGCDFEPIIEYTVAEVRTIGLSLGLPQDLVCKIPADGLTENTDEQRLGFTYEELDCYIRTGTTGNPGADLKIKRMHKISEHKRRPIARFTNI